jgi:hypothetical protein
MKVLETIVNECKMAKKDPKAAYDLYHMIFEGMSYRYSKRKRQEYALSCALDSIWFDTCVFKAYGNYEEGEKKCE